MRYVVTRAMSVVGNDRENRVYIRTHTYSCTSSVSVAFVFYGVVKGPCLSRVENEWKTRRYGLVSVPQSGGQLALGVARG